MTPTGYRLIPHRRQPVSVHRRGYALITVLLFLMLATILAVTAIKQVMSQERLAANQRAWSMAMMGAEAAARAAERWLLDFYETAGGGGIVATPDGSSGVYSTGASGTSADFAAFMAARRWETDGAVELSGTRIDFQNVAHATARLAEQPRYMIEDLGKFRPPGAGNVGEGGATGNVGYQGTAGMSPAGNSDLRVFRVVGKATGPSPNFVVTVQSIYAGRAQQ